MRLENLYAVISPAVLEPSAHFRLIHGAGHRGPHLVGGTMISVVEEKTKAFEQELFCEC